MRALTTQSFQCDTIGRIAAQWACSVRYIWPLGCPSYCLVRLVRGSHDQYFHPQARGPIREFADNPAQASSEPFLQALQRFFEDKERQVLNDLTGLAAAEVVEFLEVRSELRTFGCFHTSDVSEIGEQGIYANAITRWRFRVRSWTSRSGTLKARHENVTRCRLSLRLAD